MTPRHLLGPSEAQGEIGKRVFQDRLRRYLRGERASLLHDATGTPAGSKGSGRDAKDASKEEARRKAAATKVRLREVGRARQLLTSNGLAPGTSATLEELTDVNLKPPRLTAPLPAAAVNYVPSSPLLLEADALASALRAGGRGSAPDLAGMRYEHLRVLLEDDDSWALFVDLAKNFARADVPLAIMQALRLGKMTALQKDNGKVRGIVAGAVLRRVVCRAVASQHADAFLQATAPFQFALQTPASAEALVMALRAVTDFDPDTVVLNLDGVGAFDHVRRTTFMDKLLRAEAL